MVEDLYGFALIDATDSKIPFNQGCWRDTAGRQWVEDAVVRLVAVMALDRFADFVSDQVKSTSVKKGSTTVSTLTHYFDTATRYFVNTLANILTI